MEIKTVKVKNPQELNFILGQAHFIKTVEDLYEVLICSSPSIKFGLAFCESSGKRLVRFSGNEGELVELAKENALSIAAGHSFIIFLRDAFPINVLNRIKNVPEVCRIFCATANPAEVIISQTEQGRGILGVIDGQPPLGIEGKEDIAWRREFLRKIGYKQG